MTEYIGFVWKDDQPRMDFKIQAKSLQDAKREVLAQYGEGFAISIWNGLGRALGLNDALIAHSAMQEGVSLITGDRQGAARPRPRRVSRREVLSWSRRPGCGIAARIGYELVSANSYNQNYGVP